MMANQCVMCGAEMPEGDHVCKTCQAVRPRPLILCGGYGVTLNNLDDRIGRLMEEREALDAQIAALRSLKGRMENDKSIGPTGAHENRDAYHDPGQPGAVRDER